MSNYIFKNVETNNLKTVAINLPAKYISSRIPQNVYKIDQVNIMAHSFSFDGFNSINEILEAIKEELSDKNFRKVKIKVSELTFETFEWLKSFEEFKDISFREFIVGSFYSYEKRNKNFLIKDDFFINDQLQIWKKEYFIQQEITKREV